MKNGGAEIRVLSAERVGTFVAGAPENLSMSMDTETLGVAFVVLQNDRTVRLGFCYESGITNSDLLGMVEALKTEIIVKEVIQ